MKKGKNQNNIQEVSSRAFDSFDEKPKENMA